MHELVLVVSDLYLTQEGPEQPVPSGLDLPGLEHVARFGTRTKIAGGWRAWMAQWLTGRDAHASVAGIAAAAVAGGARADTQTVWMATPVHLIAGLTSLHLDRRSILRLTSEDQTALADDFRRVFHDSRFYLLPIESGDFLLYGPKLMVAESLEPSRVMGASVADIQRADPADPTLRRLGAEIEMWLHEHPVNAARSRRGQAPITGLWLWGGGPSSSTSAPQGKAANGDVAPSDVARRDVARAGVGRNDGACGDIAFGNDAYLLGLWATAGQKVFPLPPQLAGVFSYPPAPRAALVVEVGPMLHAHGTWTLFDAFAQIDRDFISPAVEALRAGTLERFVILANDHELSVRARDRFKIWRRASPGLSGLR